MILLGNVMRVIAGALYFYVVVTTIYVVIIYYRIHEKERHYDKGSWIGLLPHHVWLVGISYLAYASSAVIWLVNYWGRPVSPFSVMVFLGGLTGARAMRLIIKFEQKRMVP